MFVSRQKNSLTSPSADNMPSDGMHSISNKGVMTSQLIRLFSPVLLRGDHTSADSYLTIVPRRTEFVVFSIDGSFAASVSIMGSDPKVRAGAVDVVR